MSPCHLTDHHEKLTRQLNLNEDEAVLRCTSNSQSIFRIRLKQCLPLLVRPPCANSTLILEPQTLIPLRDLTAFSASDDFTYSANANPGGFLATHTSTTSPHLDNSRTKSSLRTFSTKPPIYNFRHFPGELRRQDIDLPWKPEDMFDTVAPKAFEVKCKVVGQENKLSKKVMRAI